MVMMVVNAGYAEGLWMSSPQRRGTYRNLLRGANGDCGLHQVTLGAYSGGHLRTIHHMHKGVWGFLCKCPGTLGHSPPGAIQTSYVRFKCAP